MLPASHVEACTTYVLEKSRHVIETFGLRPPGSEAERRTQELVRKELEACCDTVTIEQFPVAQKAFMGQQRVSSVLIAVSVACFFVSPWLAALFSLAAGTVLWHELLRYHLFLDPFFPKLASHNVAGRIAPRGEKRRRIILNGHPDAAYEWHWLYHYPRIFPLFVVVSLVGLLVKIVLDLGMLALFLFWPAAFAAWWTPAVILQLITLSGAIIGFRFSSFTHVSPGANDNLTGTFIAVGVAKYLKEAGIALENTELMVLITGSEEAGLRGAKAYAAAHRHEFQDVETIFIALDTMRDLKHLTIQAKDLNGTVRHDPGVCNLLKDAGHDAGLDLPYGSIFLGASDATAFTQAGIRSAALTAMDPAPADYYHNRRDHWSNMDPECIRKSIEVVAAALARYDRGGAPALPK